MSFNTATFVAFFLAFYLAHAVMRRRGLRLGLILVSSAIFYGAWDYRFLPLLFGSIVLDFYLARGIARAVDPVARRRLLIASVAMNLGLLGVFKYTSFALENTQSVLTLLGLDVQIPAVDIILPVGISFYTFQSMSYTIDVYRGQLEPTDSLPAFAASVSFFPQLVAGPIIRAAHLVPQMLEGPRLEPALVRVGVLLVALGAFKKTVADLLAVVADRVFAAPDVSTVEAWLGALAFTGQIYGDFAGYTDIAIGLAFLLGYHFPSNFRLPYVASSPSDFWRRWHISLSTWLRDYLYISLGGNRTNLYRNLLLTMLLGGLWHGAAWTFVAWGAYHGLLLVAYRLLSPRLPRAPRFLAVGVMFYFTVIGWVLFRAESMSDVWVLIAQMHSVDLSGLDPAVGLSLTLVGAALVVPHALDALVIRSQEGRALSPGFVYFLAVAALVFALVFGGSDYAFIYFQF